MGKKAKVPTRQDYVKKLDATFSKFIRLRDSFVRWWVRYVKCPLCWSVVERTKAQCMHFIKRSIMRYRFDEMNCHAGCMRCNVMLHGNYIIYTRRMQIKYWVTQVDQMIYNKATFNWRTRELKEMIDLYQEKVDALLKGEPLEKVNKIWLKQETLFDNSNSNEWEGS